MALSEASAWRRVEALGRELQASRAKGVSAAGRELHATAVEMLGQLRRGGHANPPGDVMSERVYSLAYRHQDDGRDYKHDFGPGVRMIAMRDGSIRLVHRDRKTLHEDFS